MKKDGKGLSYRDLHFPKNVRGTYEHNHGNWVSQYQCKSSKFTKMWFKP